MKSFAAKFAKLMQSKYEMSMMSELTYFLWFASQTSKGWNHYKSNINTFMIS